MVGGGMEAVPGIQAALGLKIHVVVSDIDENAPGFGLADDKMIASTYNVEQTVSAAQKYHRDVRPIDGVMSVASDVPLTVASVADALGLPGISTQVAKLATDKLAMKQQFLASGVPIPWFSKVTSKSELSSIASKQGFPLVLKPVDSRGSRGVLRLNRETNLDWAYETSARHSNTGRVMVEAFLAGPQVSTESIVLNGVAHTPGFSDRNYAYLDRYAPYFIENGGELPSRLPKEQQRAVRDLKQQAAKSLGIDNWVAKGDIVVHDGKPHVIELAARLSGGYFCTHEIPLNTGVKPVEAVIRLALGLPVSPQDLQPQFERPVAQRYLFPTPGRVLSVTGVEQARQIEGVAEVVVKVKPGDVVPIPTDSNAAAAMVIAVSDTKEEAVLLAEQAIAQVTIETEPK